MPLKVSIKYFGRPFFFSSLNVQHVCIKLNNLKIIKRKRHTYKIQKIIAKNTHTHVAQKAAILTDFVQLSRCSNSYISLCTITLKGIPSNHSGTLTTSTYM